MLPPICPLLHRPNATRVPCKAAECAWWLTGAEACAMVTLAEYAWALPAAAAAQAPVLPRSKPAKAASKG